MKSSHKSQRVYSCDGNIQIALNGKLFPSFAYRWFQKLWLKSYNSEGRETITETTLTARVSVVYDMWNRSVPNARFIPNSRGSWNWLTTKNGHTGELVGMVVCSSYVTHQKSISYRILAITLKSTSSTIAFNRQKRSWNLSISLASDPTCSWILLWSQVFVGWS